jgi:hypothetical protein
MAEKEAREISPHPAQTVREITQIMTRSMLEAQQRNLQFVQTTLNQAMELLESHVEATGALLQEVEQQPAEWQNVAPTGMASQWVETYLRVLAAPFSFYQPMLDGVFKTLQQGLGTVQQATEELEETARSPRQVIHRANKA